MEQADKKWSAEAYAEWQQSLISLSDQAYRQFHSGLIPGSEYPIIGIRAPRLREIARDIAKNDWREFLHYYKPASHEEVLIKGLIISAAKCDIDERLALADSYVDEIKTWAQCDMFCGSFKEARKHPERCFSLFKSYMASDNPWRVRVGLIMFLSHFITENFIDEILRLCNTVKCGHYYVSMGMAWLISACYIKFPEKTRTFLSESRLDSTTINKAIQKCRESFRVSKEDKEMLLTLKRK